MYIQKYNYRALARLIVSGPERVESWSPTHLIAFRRGNRQIMAHLHFLCAQILRVHNRLVAIRPSRRKGARTRHTRRWKTFVKIGSSCRETDKSGTHVSLTQGLGVPGRAPSVSLKRSTGRLSNFLHTEFRFLIAPKGGSSIRRSGARIGQPW